MTDVAESRATIADLENVLLDNPETFPKVDIKTNHYFGHGTYVREVIMPAGTLVTGKIHRKSCVNILSMGVMRVSMSNGEAAEIQAPHTFVSGPGIKKAVYAVTDCVFVNVHPWTGPEDVDLVEQQVIAPSYDALECEKWDG